MQVLRVCSFSTFALPPAFPPCCCPLAFRRQVRRLTYRISSESYPGYPECVVRCHGAGRFANSIRGVFVCQLSGASERATGFSTPCPLLASPPSSHFPPVPPGFSCWSPCPLCAILGIARSELHRHELSLTPARHRT